jgi:hypothetical protein
MVGNNAALYIVFICLYSSYKLKLCALRSLPLIIVSEIMTLVVAVVTNENLTFRPQKLKTDTIKTHSLWST